MDDKHIAQFEARLERLVEGAFTRLFRRQISPHDLAMKLARSMDDSLRYQPGERPLAPDTYTIHLHPAANTQLEQHLDSPGEAFGTHLVELATQSGYRIHSTPVVHLKGDNSLSRSEVVIKARHSRSRTDSTSIMKAIRTPDDQAAPTAPQLIINGSRVVDMTDAVINIGRGTDNDIMIDDNYVSRHHLQIRLRFGIYTLFDVNSRGGTQVNNVQVNEHSLQPGDVIEIGNTRLIYTTEESRSDSFRPGTTQGMDAVDDDA
jgi:hypothetical protein